MVFLHLCLAPLLTSFGEHMIFFFADSRSCETFGWNHIGGVEKWGNASLELDITWDRKRRRWGTTHASSNEETPTRSQHRTRESYGPNVRPEMQRSHKTSSKVPLLHTKHLLKEKEKVKKKRWSRKKKKKDQKTLGYYGAHQWEKVTQTARRCNGRHCRLAAPGFHRLSGTSVHLLPACVWISSGFSSFLQNASRWIAYHQLPLQVAPNMRHISGVMFTYKKAGWGHHGWGSTSVLDWSNLARSFVVAFSTNQCIECPC